MLFIFSDQIMKTDNNDTEINSPLYLAKITLNKLITDTLNIFLTNQLKIV